MSARGHRGPGPTGRPDFGLTADDDPVQPHSSSVRCMYDEAMARAAVHAKLPLRRYLAVLLEAT